MKIEAYKNRELNLHDKVNIYRCLNKKGHVYSIKQNGYVVGHTTEITLRGVEFKISPAGKKRAQEEGQRNVHAFVVGYIEPNTEACERYLEPISYNPFNDIDFFYKKTRRELHFAPKLVINEKGIFA